MKAMKTVAGLIYDDPWLFFGILAALVAVRVLTAVGFAGASAGVVLMVLLFAAMVVSLQREVRRSSNKT